MSSFNFSCLYICVCQIWEVFSYNCFKYFFSPKLFLFYCFKDIKFGSFVIVPQLFFSLSLFSTPLCSVIIFCLSTISLLINSLATEFLKNKEIKIKPGRIFFNEAIEKFKTHLELNNTLCYFRNIVFLIPW